MAKILVVDDNPVNLKLAGDLLQREGHAVIRCPDAEQAQKHLKNSLPELILLDIGLPGMDGLTFTKVLKSDPRTAGVKIVALTAFAMKGDEEKILAAGCDGYIAKPIDTRGLPAQVMAFLSGK